MAPPVTDRVLFTDTFDRADSTDLGANWDSGYTGETNLQIVSNMVEASVVGGSSNSMESVNAVTGLDKSWVQVTVGTLAGSVLAVIRLHLHFQDPPTRTYYSSEIRLNNSVGVTRVQLEDCVNGAFTGRGLDDSFTFTTGDLVRFEVSEGTQRLYKNGTLLISAAATNPLIPATGRMGLSLYVNTGGSLADLRVNDFTGGDIVTPLNLVRP